jgi:demethylmenaquinone methyltransferase/2-methoxy-6-polyprenyl-1,4-benzoquinol methylase
LKSKRRAVKDDVKVSTSPAPGDVSLPERHKTEEEKADFGDRHVSGREKSGYVQRHFSAIAGKYDFMNTLLSFGLHYRWKRLAVAALELKAGERVLDVCGGTADLSLLAARTMGPEGYVILCDFNRAMLEAGKPKVRRASLEGRIISVQGDAESLCFPTGIFDAAMVGFGIRNLTRMERGIAEMYRILKPGGRLMCLEFSLPVSGWFRLLYNFYSFRLIPLAGKVLAGNRDVYRYLPESIRRFPPPDRVAALLKEIGFSEVVYHRITNGIAVIYKGMKP